MPRRKQPDPLEVAAPGYHFVLASRPSAFWQKVTHVMVETTWGQSPHFTAGGHRS